MQLEDSAKILETAVVVTFGHTAELMQFLTLGAIRPKGGSGGGACTASTHVRDSYHERVGVDASEREGRSFRETVLWTLEVRHAIGIKHNAHAGSGGGAHQGRETAGTQVRNTDNTNLLHFSDIRPLYCWLETKQLNYFQKHASKIEATQHLIRRVFKARQTRSTHNVI